MCADVSASDLADRGTNENEGGYFVPLTPDIIGVPLEPFDNKTFAAAISHFFNESAASQVIDLYANIDNGDKRVSRVITDFFFGCSNRWAAHSITKHHPNVWIYRFRHAMPNSVMYKLFGDYHGAELGFVFDEKVRDQPLCNTDFMEIA